MEGQEDICDDTVPFYHHRSMFWKDSQWSESGHFSRDTQERVRPSANYRLGYITHVKAMGALMFWKMEHYPSRVV